MKFRMREAHAPWVPRHGSNMPAVSSLCTCVFIQPVVASRRQPVKRQVCCKTVDLGSMQLNCQAYLAESWLERADSQHFSGVLRTVPQFFHVCTVRCYLPFLVICTSKATTATHQLVKVSPGRLPSLALGPAALRCLVHLGVCR